MEKDSGFGYHHHHHPYMMSLNPSLYGFPINTAPLYTKPVCENPHSRNAPSFPCSGLQHSNLNEPNYSRNWLYNTPHFHNAFPPVFDFGKIPTTGPTPPPKRFLVFDQSGDKTTLIYNTSGAHTPPVQFIASRAPNPLTPYNSTKDEFRVCSNPLNPSTNDKNIDDNSREDEEDSDELDALLCSDSDFSEDDDDEETSTGHSPSTMTDDGVRDSAEEIGEEVDSVFAVPAKRRRISDGPALGDDDALSVCGDVDNQCSKRMRREKIHETLSALRSVIPNAEGKDAIFVIDEAIKYLRSLKVEAKALGLDAAL
ncbi:transcription factor bhlh145 [Phtheirospermum japonicum]|uniref:Transcription factor bhlh145 n=1 Tax=Phtheirospermum japonicum TaxID=374723 RepID=A0A830BQZ1_9LAMI|nr:transcription factor bhlh145 [Phtheirospermum japonicum]